MKLLFFIIGISLSPAVFPQIDIINNSLVDVKVNHLYSGVDNVVQVTGVNIVSPVQLICSHGTIAKSSDNKNEFIIRVNRLKADTLSVYQQGKLLSTKIFEVKVVPLPKVQVGKNNDTVLSVKQILKDPGLFVFFPACLLDHKVTIHSFSTSITNGKGQKLHDFPKTAGSRFSKELISSIVKLKKGDKILFKDLKIIGPDSASRKVPDLTIHIE